MSQQGSGASSYKSTTVQRGFGRGPMAGRGAPVEKPKDRKKTLIRLLGYFLEFRGELAALMILVVVGVVGTVLAPRYQSSAIDAIVGKEFDAVPHFLLIMLAMYLLYGASMLAQGYLSAVLSQKMTGKIRSDLFSRIVYLPISYTDANSHGDLISRMTNDADNISNVISQSISSMFSGILTLIGTVMMMLWYNAALGLLTCSTVILTLIVTKILTKYMRRYYVRRQALLGSLNGTVEEMVTNCRTVTAYNLQDKVITDFVKTADDLTRTGIIAETIGGSMGPVMNMFNNVSFVVVAVFGAWFALQGYISVGVISAFIIYAKQFSRPINELAQLYGQILTALAGAERIFAVLDEAPEDLEGEKITEDAEGVIEFKNVNFSYVPGKQIISDFSLKIESGKKIALVGSTGSGKTTIINLLMRFYDIDSGEILLDGKNIRDLALKDLRNQIGIVLQDTVLFSDTVRANLTYAQPDISEQALENAVKRTRCDRVIRALADGYDTVLSGSGAGLSQGQRQLLAIGRAFLSHPQILILDEATSSVDTRTEKYIQDGMAQLMQGRTCLIIAHRLSTIRDADQIIVMDHGRIAESGSHEALLEKHGKYYDLYMTQFAGLAT